MTEPTKAKLIDGEAEQGVLGAFLLSQDPDTVQPVRKILPTPEYFASGAYRILYEAMCTLIDKGVALDPITLRNYLQGQKLLDEVGGVEAVAQLADAVPTAANAVFHASIVRELFDRRQMVAQGERLITLAHDQQLAPADVLATAVTELSRTTVHRAGFKPRSWTEILIDAGSRIEDRVRHNRWLTGVPSGLTDLDRILGGAEPGEAIFLAARPSIGKTALALKLARNAALHFLREAKEDEEPMVSMVASREMRIDHLVERLLSAEADLRLRQKLMLAKLVDHDFTKIAEAQGRLNRLPLRLMDSETHDLTSPGHIRLAIEHFQATEKRRVGFLVVDYIQLLHIGGDVENRNHELGMIAEALKDIGVQCGFPVLVLAQLNRENEKAARRPRSSDLRDSGEIEQVADKIILLHAEPKNPEWEEGLVEVLVDKNRNGETGSCKLAFDKHTQAWRGWAKVSDDVSRSDRGVAA